MATKRSDEVLVSIGRRTEAIRDRELAHALRKSHELYRKSREAEPHMTAAKELIAARAEEFLGEGQGSVHFENDGLACRVTTRTEVLIPEENLVEVRRLLGRRFRDLVRVKTRYVGTRELLYGADEEVRELIDLRRLCPRFTWQCG